MDKKSRIKYIDNLKAFGILFVVLGHVNFANGAIKPWIYSFHMPLFFFAAGMLQRDVQYSGKEMLLYVWKNIWHLMIPFLFWGVIYASFNWVNLAKIFYGSHQMLGSAGSLSSLWFLPVMFIVLVLFRLIESVFHVRLSAGIKLVLSILCFAVSAILPKIQIGYPWGINVAVNAFAFFLLGSTAAHPVRKLAELLNKKRVYTIPVILAAICCLLGTLLYRNNIPQSGYINMANAVYGLMPLYVLVALCGIGFILGLSLVCDAFSFRGMHAAQRMLSAAGQHSLCIMMVHKPLIVLFRYAFSMIKTIEAVELLITGIGVLTISVIAALILDRFLPVLTGKGSFPG